MRRTNGIVTAVLLFSLGGIAQQPAQKSPPAASESSQPTQPAAAEPAFKARQRAESLEPAAVPPNLPQAAPTTMDQVVDRLVEREHNLMKMLEDRTPIVETYLQNVTPDAQLGPVPKDDRYFLGRMDFSESIDRKDYMKQPSMEKRQLG